MSLTRFTLRQIEAFTMVSDQRSFSVAADRLGLSTQAVSQLIAELENSLGFRLFDRTTRRVDLTSAGREFASSAQAVLRHVQAAETAAADVRDRAAGLVRVAAPQVLASSALPAAIRSYRDIRPKVVVRIHDAAVDKLIDAVAAGDVDLAFGPDRATGAHVSSEPLFDSPWVLWCTPEHPLAQLPIVRWSDLRGQTIVAAGRDHERSVAQMTLSAPEDERITPADVVENISTALGIAAQGLAVTLSPAYVGVLANHMGLVMRRVVDPETVRKVCLYSPVSRTLSPAAQGFADHLADWLRTWRSAQPFAD